MQNIKKATNKVKDNFEHWLFNSKTLFLIVVIVVEFACIIVQNSKIDNYEKNRSENATILNNKDFKISKIQNNNEEKEKLC